MAVNNFTTVDYFVTITDQLINTTVQELLDLFSKSEKSGTIAYLSIIAALSLTMNGIVLFLYFTNSKMHNYHHMMVANLCISDCMVTIFGSCFKLYLTAREKSLKSGTVGCTFYGFITFLGGKIASISQKNKNKHYRNLTA